jgi:predicted DNA-binding transcriptional regulator AlpA
VEAIVARLVSQQERTLYPAQWGKAATVARMLECSRSSVFRMAADGRLPRPKKLGERIALWDLQEISALLSAAPVSVPAPRTSAPGVAHARRAEAPNVASVKAKSAAAPGARLVRAPEAAPEFADPRDGAAIASPNPPKGAA